MYFKQGLKREEAIDFPRERLSSISAGVTKLSTDVCAISEFVTRLWGGGCQGQTSVFLLCCAILLFCHPVLTCYRSVLPFCY